MMAFPAARGLHPDPGHEPPGSSRSADTQIRFSFVSFFHQRNTVVPSPDLLGFMKNVERLTRRNRCFAQFSPYFSTRMNVTHARRLSLFNSYKGHRK